MTKLRRWNTSAAILGIVAFFPWMSLPAQADIIGGALEVTAKNAAGDFATYQVPLPFGGSPWVWSSSQPIEMRSNNTGELIAILNPAGHSSGFEYIDDPAVGMFFSVQSGPTSTIFTIASALLSFTTMDGEARISLGYSLTDADGDGAVLVGIGNPDGLQGAYLAQYNGSAETVSGTTFAEEIQGMNAGIYASSTASIDLPPVGFVSIPVAVFDMSVLIHFELSPNDMASGTTNFVIQPPPLSTEVASWGGIKALYR